MSMVRHLDLHYPRTDYSSQREWNRYAGWLRQQAAVSLALAPAPARPPLKAQVFGAWKGAGYTCNKVFFESLPGFYVTGNLYVPEAGRRGRRPGILCPHGHWEDGRLHDRDPMGSVVLRCLNLARQGAVVFSYDMVGYNDSCQLEHRTPAEDHFYGLSQMSLQTWNSVRALDFLLELPEVDSRRIGVTGTSGGGTQTFALCAVDDRVAATAPICMISYIMQGGCVCENAPLLRVGATSVDLARLFAPKPMFMGSCTGDWTRNTPTEEWPAVRGVYRLFGAAERVMHHHIDCGHGYNREMREHVYGFFQKHLWGAKSAGPVREIDVKRPPLRDRMVWWGRPAPDAIPNARFIAQWRERAEATLRPHLRTAESARKGLGGLLPLALGIGPDTVAEYSGKRPALSHFERDGRILRVRAQRDPRLEEAKKFEFFSAYNRTTFAERVVEILAAVGNTGASVTLQDAGGAGLECLAAAALSRKVASVRADLAGFDPRKDDHWEKRMNSPSLRQVGGLATVLALLGKRPVELAGVTAAVRELQKRFA